MADFNAKTATPDTDGPGSDSSILFGADSQADVAPKVYSFGGIKAWVKGFLDMPENPAAIGSLIPANASFDFWLRGTSVAVLASTVGAYTADRWALTTNADQAMTVSRQTGNGANTQYAGRVQRNAGQTGTATAIFEYPLDTDEVIALRGKKATIAMVLQAGANWSPASGNLTVALYVGTGAAARRAGTAFTTETTPISTVQAITTTATKYTFTSAAVVPANSTQASILILFTPVGTAGADDWFQIDSVQLINGASSPTYSPVPLPVQQASLNRHLRLVNTGGLGVFETTTRFDFGVSFEVDMRIDPAASILGTIKIRNISGGATPTATTPTVSPVMPRLKGAYLEINVASFTVVPTIGNIGLLACDDGANGVLLSSEI